MYNSISLKSDFSCLMAHLMKFFRDNKDSDKHRNNIGINDDKCITLGHYEEDDIKFIRSYRYAQIISIELPSPNHLEARF